ncbi:unnamed protein product [Trifolium pratense]|uniref:Uncharacterized protein n=1 Tax=Trifolium pratense TaxID=57577 RepID=A0ACB0LFB0_TRIPR|nr:unnamed protein product [Trifolium pratense]
MGADKVFVHSTENGDAMSVINNAKEFFQLVFWNWMRWDKETSPYRRGAWVRLYGVPLHAWNEQFFQLCVFESGRFLRTDSSSGENISFSHNFVFLRGEEESLGARAKGEIGIRELRRVFFESRFYRFCGIRCRVVGEALL